MSGIFKTQGVWSLGFDFMADGTPSAGGVLDYVVSTPTVGATYARFTGKGIQLQSGQVIGKSFGTNLVTAIAGFGFLTTSLPGGGSLTPICTVYDNTGAQPIATLALNSTGQIGWYSSGGLTPTTVTAPSSLMGSVSSLTLLANNYVFIEILATVGSSGSLQARVNGTPYVTFSGNTQKTNPYCNLLLLGSGGSGATTIQIDDWYMLDTTASAPLNTFLGPGRVQTDGPNADSATGGLNAWTATSPQGTDFGNCANIPANTGQYNSSNTVGQRMSLRFPSIASATQCLFMNTWYTAEIDAAGSRTVEPIFRNASVDQVGPPVTLSGSFVTYNQPSTVDPATSALWASESISAAAGCEIGLEVAS